MWRYRDFQSLMLILFYKIFIMIHILWSFVYKQINACVYVCEGHMALYV